jgi:hypothetical protein
MYLGFSFGAGGSSGDNIYHYIILGLNWAWARKLKIGHDVGSALFRAVGAYLVGQKSSGSPNHI